MTPPSHPSAAAFGEPRALAPRPAPAAVSQRGPARRLDLAFEAAQGAVRMTYARGEEIFGEGEPAKFVYRVLSGSVRTYRTLSDGRRQICNFLLPGDYFGLEPGLDYRTTAEALAGATLSALRRSSLADIAQRDVEIARELWALATEGLQRSHDHLVLLGRKTASERVASFLIDLAGRLGARDEFDLAMSRQDIADYLGLTIETVSRTFSQLEGLKMVKAHNSRRIRLTDRAGLEMLCE
jgi:CRP-like cAMP-binding protein